MAGSLSSRPVIVPREPTDVGGTSRISRTTPAEYRIPAALTSTPPRAPAPNSWAALTRPSGRSCGPSDYGPAARLQYTAGSRRRRRRHKHIRPRRRDRRMASLRPRVPRSPFLPVSPVARFLLSLGSPPAMRGTLYPGVAHLAQGRPRLRPGANPPRNWPASCIWQ